MGQVSRVLGRYSREEKLISLPTAIHKLTEMPTQRFGLSERGSVRQGFYADLVVFDLSTILDRATLADPIQCGPRNSQCLGERGLSYDGRR
jgi:N-acyl-D-amino-acid deacylase